MALRGTFIQENVTPIEVDMLLRDVIEKKNANGTQTVVLAKLIDAIARGYRGSEEPLGLWNFDAYSSVVNAIRDLTPDQRSALAKHLLGVISAEAPVPPCLYAGKSGMVDYIQYVLQRQD